MTQVVLAAPKVTGTIRQTAYYNPLTIGETAPILLIGHSDATQQETPYRVSSMRDAVNWLNADSTSPLLRALLEVYNIGCRDIWLYSAAPMSEYEGDISARNTPDPELGNLTFYELWHIRLNNAYNLLKNYDAFDVVVPLEASLTETSDIDFATPLAEFCENVLSISGKITMGVIGTRATSYNQTLFDDISNDSVFDTIGEKGKMVMAVMGEGVMVNTQMSVTYTSPYAASVAGLLATTPLSRSIYGIPITTASSLVGFDLKDSQKEQLAQAKINPVIRTQRGKRGINFQTMLVTDNTMAPDGSDFWSMNQTRTTAEIINTIRAYGEAYIGTTASLSFKQVVRDYFRSLVAGGFIKDFALDISFDNRTGKAQVQVGIMPNFGIRNIYFTVETGPGS